MTAIPVEIKNLSFAYRPGNPVLQEITFQAAAGECIGIIGLNGSGKTTLCYCLSGIIPHYYRGELTGDVLINDKNTRDIDLRQIAWEVGIILQNPNDQIIMPTVTDELVFGLENNLVPRQEMAKRVSQVLELVNIRHLRDEDPNRLSGGEKQLVAIAAALALQPSILVFDEALSMLDENSSRRVRAVLAMLKKQKKTLIIVDHTWKAAPLFDRVLVLEAGKIIYQGATEALLKDRAFLAAHQLVLDESHISDQSLVLEG